MEQTPEDVIAGHDPQLEKAIEMALAALQKSPPRGAEAAAVPGAGQGDAPLGRPDQATWPAGIEGA